MVVISLEQFLETHIGKLCSELNADDFEIIKNYIENGSGGKECMFTVYNPFGLHTVKEIVIAAQIELALLNSI
jgi:hypothetical protein